MDLSAIYSKTPKGLRARASLIGGLSSHLMKVLTHIDGNSRAESILLKFDKLTGQQLSADLAKLEQEGYIRLATVTSSTDDSWALTINFEPMQVEEYQSEEDLEAAAQAKKAEQAQQLARQQAEQQAKQDEEKRLAAAEKAEKRAQKIREKEKIKAEAKVKAQIETEREQQQAAEAARIKAQQAAEQLEKQQTEELAAKLAEETRLKAELKAREAAEQAEAAAEAKAKEHAMREIERISRESEEAQKKQALETKAKQAQEELKAQQELQALQEAERLEALRLAEVEAAEKAQKEKLLQQQLAAEALEKERLAAEKLAQQAVLKQQQEQEKIAQEKLRVEAQEKEKLAKEQAHLEIANVLRKAEEDRKKAAAQLKAEKLEAKRQAKAEQEERLLAERKRKEEAKEIAKEQAKQQKLKAQAEEKAKAEALENAHREQGKIAKQTEVNINAEQTVKQEIDALALKADAENQTINIVHAKLLAEEQANLTAKENARLEMERIGREAELARQKTSAIEHLDEDKNQKNAQSKKSLSDNDLPILDVFSAAEAAEEAEFEEEEQAAEAERKIQRTIEKTAEKTAKKSAEDTGRADIKNAAIAEAEALASVHGKRRSFVSAKRVKQWLGSVSKVAFIYVPVLALVLLALLHFINLSTLIKPIEQLASDSIGEPVEIKKVYASLWPQPHLVLENVVIGASDIKTIHVLPRATSLFEEAKVVKSLVIEGLNIEHANFGKPINWASNISKAKNLKVEQINLKNLTLAIRDMQLESFDGKVTLTDTGVLGAVDLVSGNNALSVTILPRADSYEIVLKAANWMLPFNQKIMFSSLNAKGLANQNKISFSQIEGEIYGGSVTGQASVEWPEGANQWQTSGNFALTNASAEQLLSTFGSAVVIDGKLALNGSFSSKAREASKLAAATVMSANFDVRQGSIKGVELARAVMSRGSQSLVGDSTNFDKLSGSLKMNQNQYQFGRLVLASQQFNASGFINMNSNQTLTGRLNADLAAQSRRLQANFAITGRGKDLKSN